jgi:dynactin complex subunit
MAKKISTQYKENISKPPVHSHEGYPKLKPKYKFNDNNYENRDAMNIHKDKDGNVEYIVYVKLIIVVGLIGLIGWYCFS